MVILVTNWLLHEIDDYHPVPYDFVHVLLLFVPPLQKQERRMKNRRKYERDRNFINYRKVRCS